MTSTPAPEVTPADGLSGLHRIYDAERPALLRFLVARLGSVSDAEEVLHELWTRLATTSSGPVLHPRAYLFKMAYNLALDRRRAERRRVDLERSIAHDPAIGHGYEAVVSDSDPDAATVLIEREEHKRLDAAIEALPDGARRVLVLHKIDELSHGEVAERLGISRSGVEKHMAVAMRHLRAALLDCGTDASAASSFDEGTLSRGR